MIYRKQTGFDDFHCIADKCPKSCCEGWQIMIDDASLKKYKFCTGEFRERMINGVDRQEHCFRQQNMRCSMLAPNGLCDLQSTLGESWLCDTCRQYPRHLEEFLDLREYSLSLSCPEVVRMLVDPAYRFALTESEDDTYDDPDDFEDFDLFIFDKLTFAREKMLNIAGDSSIPLQKRLDMVAAAGFRLQDLYDQGEIFEMDDISCEPVPVEENVNDSGVVFSYDYLMQSLELLLDLEVLETSWSDLLQSTKEYWLQHPAASDEWKQAMHTDTEHSAVFEKLLQSLIFTYVCGSIYDGQIYACTMIAVMSVRWIMMIHYANPVLSLEETIYLFSREVEHSDQNVTELISCFGDEV
ncbi:MAG: flagellin lysine-N-methylase [Eubacteriales bacterium]|nr:flagellin lysine-N-methylase [Eubacteriales bacterium]